MKLFLTLISIASATLFSGGQALASDSTTKYVRCMERNITGAEQEVIIRWLFAGIATHPAVSDIMNVSSAQLDNANKDIGNLVMDLLTVRCKAEFRTAMLDPKNRGTNPTETAFGRLGELSMNYIMADEIVTKNLVAFTAYLDNERFMELLKE